MKIVLLLSLFFPLCFAKKTEPIINIFHSESTSFLHFLAAGFGVSFTSGSMKQLIESKKINGFDDKRLKGAYNKVSAYLNNGYNFKSAETRPAGFYGEDAFLGLSVTNPKLADFEKNLSLLMPYDGIESYFYLRAHFYNQFKKHVWNVTLRSQKVEIAKIEKLLDQTKFSNMLKRSKTFYNSSYPLEIPFKVALIPIDDRGQKKLHASAQNLRDIQIVPYHISKGVKSSMDVVFHEFCHALYEGQSRKIKDEIENFYLSSSHSHAVFVYRYLNEALATALGNGWYGEVLHGKLPEGSWYTVGYIDGLAKAFLPVVKGFLAKGKSINKEFYKKTLEIAKKAFPKAPYEVDTNFIALRILSDHKYISPKAVSEQLRKNFRIQSIRRSSPIERDDWNRVFGIDNSTTFLISSESKKTLAKLKNHVSKVNLAKLEGKNDFLVIFPLKGRYLFWANIKSLDKVPRIIKSIKSKKYLKQDFELISL